MTRLDVNGNGEPALPESRSSVNRISCLTVTQAGRFESLQRAAGDFQAQTWPERELVIVHDGDLAAHERLLGLARFGNVTDTDVIVHRAAPGLRLGDLRNLAVELATGTYVCQWDDDDRYHPQRLEMQLQALLDDGADFCFLGDQLHLFAAARTLYWDDWACEVPPLNCTPGSLFGRRDKMPRYPALARGEDTAVVAQLLANRCRITRLCGRGYLYVYVFDGNNTWDYGHHAAISAWKRMPGAQLVRRAALLQQRLAEYRPPLGRVTMPSEFGALVFGEAPADNEGSPRTL